MKELLEKFEDYLLNNLPKIDTFHPHFENAMQDNIAVDSGYSKKQIKNRTSRNSDGDLCQKIYIDDFYYHFDEYGSSKSKKNVGKIERATDDIADDVINEAFKSILN